MDSGRRTFLGRLGQGLGLLLGAGSAILTLRFLRPPRTRDLAQQVRLGPAAALPQGASRHLAEHDVYVLSGSEGLYALSGKCSHLGCSVRLQPEGFSCPCHGARFDKEGRPLSGPAPAPLTRLLVTVDDRNQAWLHLDVRRA